MNTQSPQAKTKYLIECLERHGQGDYIGESISQLEHCLQAAHQAQKSGTSVYVCSGYKKTTYYQNPILNKTTKHYLKILS